MDKLPPIEDTEFDGDKFTTDIKHEPCKHDVSIVNNEVRCSKCGSAWAGSGIDRLYKAFKNQG